MRKRSVAGVPFRLSPLRRASVALVSQTAGGSPVTGSSARSGVAQIYQPKLLIAEFKAPATLAVLPAPVMR